MINSGMIEQEIKELKLIRENVEKSIQRLDKLSPAGGVLRAVRHGRTTQFFIREKGDSSNGTYIKKDDRKKAEIMAQAEYERKLLHILSSEIEELENLVNIPKGNPYQTAMESVTELKKSLIRVPFVSDEEYLLYWLSKPYDSPIFRENAPEYYTKKGLRVRSKSEVLIAEMLDSFEIPYLYEKPIEFSNGHVVHPDFTLLKISAREEIYWEHFGMMDDMEYRNNAFMKIREYESNGYYQGVNFIWTFETTKYPLNTRNVRGMISKISTEFIKENVKPT